MRELKNLLFEVFSRYTQKTRGGTTGKQPKGNSIEIHKIRGAGIVFLAFSTVAAQASWV